MDRLPRPRRGPSCSASTGEAAHGYPHTISRLDRRSRYRKSEGEPREVTLVFPGQADIDRNLVPVMTPIGAALIGICTGQSITRITRDGRKHMLTALGVTQPESSSAASCILIDWYEDRCTLPAIGGVEPLGHRATVRPTARDRCSLRGGAAMEESVIADSRLAATAPGACAISFRAYSSTEHNRAGESVALAGSPMLNCQREAEVRLPQAGSELPIEGDRVTRARSCSHTG